MKDKPPFLLYSNFNKSISSRASSSKRFRNNVNLIFNRIPKDILENSQELKKIVFKERIPVYDIINLNKKPNEIKITNDMSDQAQKNLENINSFRENFYEFNQEERELLENAYSAKEENDSFGNQYHKIQNIKNKYKTGTYLDYDYLIPVANRYSLRGIKVPKINTGKSVFSGNPLILSGSELEDFIVYNLGDRKKGTQFLERLEDIMEKKEKGIFTLSQSEMKNRMENPENMKGYIPPEILIPQLQNDIQTSKSTLNNIEDLELFFKNNKRKLDLFDRSENNKKTIKIKKNLSSLKRFNNNNNSRNISMLGYLSPLFQKNFHNNNSNNLENSALSNDKSTLFIFSKLPSNNLNKKRLSIISDLYKQQNKRKSNLPNINFFFRNIKGRFSNANIHNNKRNSLQNNSADAKNKILSRNFSVFEGLSKDEKLEEKTNNDESEKSELELIKKFDYKSKNELKRNINLKLDLSDNNNDIFSEREKSLKKLKKMKFINLKEDKNLIKTEKIFNLVLKDKTLDYNRSKIIEYLKEKGYNTSRNIDNKELYINFDRVEKGMQNNILQNELKIRGDLADTRYKNLLKKNYLYSKQLEENSLKYKKMICEKI